MEAAAEREGYARGRFQLVYLLLALLLAAVVALGFVLRVWNLNFDQGIGSHPDERSTACFYATTIGLPESWQQFWDPRQSPLNPLWDRAQQTRRSFTYGHFPLYLGVAMGNLWHSLAPLADAVGAPAPVVQLMARANYACDGLAVAGRFTIALLDTLTIWLIFLLGRRAFGPWAGLAAAAFYAVTAQAVQLSHFFAMDPASTTFTVLAVLGSVMMVQDRSVRAALLAGVAAGLAIASKFSALPVLAVPALAALIWLANSRQPVVAPADSPVAAPPYPPPAISQLKALASLCLAPLIAAIAFFVTSPYAVLDWSNFIQATLVEQGQMVRGIADMPFTRQYRNTTPYIYFIRQQVQWGMGWPLGLVGLAGSVVMLVVLVRTVVKWLMAGGRWPVAQSRMPDSAEQPLATSHRLPAYESANVLMWAWVIPYFGLTGAFLAKFNRYMSPMLPFVALFAAGALWLLWQNQPQRRKERQEQNQRFSHLALAFASSASLRFHLRRWAAIGMALVAFGGGLFWSAAYVNGVYNHPHTWITASRWIYQNVPRDSVILWELWDDPLPKSIPGEPGMDMGSAGLRNIDWSPYEEDTAEKYEILKAKLREADYVVYSSKRIYDSVDELPERYPMTNLYYEAMWDGRLGFELAQEVTSPPRLFGWVFDDRHADESWSLYDHPQVTIFRKTRDLSDAEFDALFDRSWEQAIPYYRGKDSPLSPLLEALGLGSDPASAQSGLVGIVVRLLAGGEGAAGAEPESPEADLMLDQPPPALPLVDNYRWNRVASASPWLSVAIWWLAVGLLGWAAWPLAFALLPALHDRGYMISKTLGWLVAGWLLWIAASSGLLYNTVRNAWLAAGLLIAAGAVAAWRQRAALGAWLRAHWGLLLIGEALFAVAYLLFVVVRMFNPDLWQPWFGGEKFMEFAFLNGILRSPTFPPVDPHFAGGYINYYYFGIYLVAYLVKLTGIYAEVAFNLAIPTLFAMTAINAFGLAYNAALTRDWRAPTRGAPTLVAQQSAVSSQRSAVVTALLAPLFVALLGNLDGFGQIVRNLAERSPVQVQSALPGVQALVAGMVGLVQVIRGEASLPAYDFWGPSRVIPNTINEFPYWSFLFADLHPHLIGIPLALLFLALLLGLLGDYTPVWRSWGRGAGLLVAGAFLLGTLASVNLWELPTYYGLGVLALLVCEYRALGRVRWLRLIAVSLVYLAGAYLFYLPFFRSYVNVGASGIGWVKAGDDLGAWLLIWGFLGFVTTSWILYSVAQRAYPVRDRAPAGRGAADHSAMAPAAPLDGPADEVGTTPKPSGVERFARALLVRFDRLPRFLYLHSRLVMAPTFGYLLGILVIPTGVVAALAALLWGRTVLALCLVLLGFGLAVLWRRGADIGAAFANLLSVTGLAILAGTQVVYLKDFLQGGDWYRMNTLFKFFVQVWVLWAVAAAIALPRLWAAANIHWTRIRRGRHGVQSGVDIVEAILPQNSGWLQRGWLPRLWQASCVLLLAASCAYLIWGTPARLSQRFAGWRPPFGTLDGLAYMDGGRYSWPDESHQIELRHDAEAIRWLLETVRGNPVVVETAEVDYYRAGSSRVASLTGLSGLRGMHESEQRYGEQVGARDALHREFWTTPDVARTEAILDELHVSLIYVGQLERYLHPEGVAKLEAMAADGRLLPVFRNEGVTIYAVPGRLVAAAGGYLIPQTPEPREDLGSGRKPLRGGIGQMGRWADGSAITPYSLLPTADFLLPTTP